MTRLSLDMAGHKPGGKFHQQLDFAGHYHDIAPATEQNSLFTADPQIRGQIALDTDSIVINGVEIKTDRGRVFNPKV